MGPQGYPQPNLVAPQYGAHPGQPVQHQFAPGPPMPGVDRNGVPMHGSVPGQPANPQFVPGQPPHTQPGYQQQQQFAGQPQQAQPGQFAAQPQQGQPIPQGQQPIQAGAPVPVQQAKP